MSPKDQPLRVIIDSDAKNEIELVLERAYGALPNG